MRLILRLGLFERLSFLLKIFHSFLINIGLSFKLTFENHSAILINLSCFALKLALLIWKLRSLFQRWSNFYRFFWTFRRHCIAPPICRRLTTLWSRRFSIMMKFWWERSFLQSIWTYIWWMTRKNVVHFTYTHKRFCCFYIWGLTIFLKENIMRFVRWYFRFSSSSFVNKSWLLTSCITDRSLIESANFWNYWRTSTSLTLLLLIVFIFIENLLILLIMLSIIFSMI